MTGPKSGVTEPDLGRHYSGAMADALRSRKGTGRFGGFAPFLVAGLLGWVLVAAPHPRPLQPAPLLVAAALTLLVIALAVLVSWRLLPDRAQLLAALVWLAVVYLMRDGAGGAASGFSTLYLLSVLWLALYGSKRQLLVALFGYGATQVAWIVAHQSADQITFAVLGTTVAALVCFTVQNLVHRVRDQNSRLRAINEVSRALAMEEDLAAARTALCVAAADVCRADVAVMYEPADSGGLAATASHLRDGSTMPDAWRHAPTWAEEALRTGHQQFVAEPAGQSPQALPSSLWQPVLRAGKPIAVVGVGWQRARRRLSTGDGVALSLLADQTTTVIERTQLLVRQGQQLEELRELDRLKTDFVSSASHELRTPITSIRGYLDVLVEGEAGPLSEEQRSFLLVADRNAHRLQTLVEDLLVVSRIESGRLQLSVRDIDLVALVGRVRESLAPQLHQSGVVLRLEVPSEAVLRADERRIEQVLVNLLSNAIKFSPNGGEVAVCVDGSAESVRITVADHGIGMPEKDLKRLFQKFFRSETATERAIPGTGLGLAICKGIIDAHGGDITVRSTPGEGTTVTVGLPRQPGNRREQHDDQRH